MNKEDVAHDAEDSNEPSNEEADRRAGQAAALHELQRLSRMTDAEVSAEFGAPGARVDRQAIQSQLAHAKRVCALHVAAPRRSGRAPRRAAPRAVSRVEASAEPPEPPPPRAGQPVGALITQRNSGLRPRRFLALVRDLKIPHARIGRLVAVRPEDFHRALGLTSATAAPAAPEPWSLEGARLRLLRGGKGGAR